MSGAGDSETPSISTSRSVRPPIGKSAGASSALITASTSAGSLVRKQAEGVADRVVEPAFGQVELDVPGLLRGARLVEPRARDEGRLRRIVARAAGRACGLAPLERLGRPSALPRPAPCRSRHGATSASGRFPCRPARKGSAAPRSSRTARRRSPCSRSRTGRSPAGPSPPSCGGSGRPSASFMRSASGMVWSCQGAPSSSSPAAADLHAGHQRGRFLRRQRGGVAVEQARRRSR